MARPVITGDSKGCWSYQGFLLGNDYPGAVAWSHPGRRYTERQLSLLCLGFRRFAIERLVSEVAPGAAFVFWLFPGRVGERYKRFRHPVSDRIPEFVGTNARPPYVVLKNGVVADNVIPMPVVSPGLEVHFFFFDYGTFDFSSVLMRVFFLVEQFRRFLNHRPYEFWVNLVLGKKWRLRVCQFGYDLARESFFRVSFDAYLEPSGVENLYAPGKVFGSV